jgi:hypothetical protein
MSDKKKDLVVLAGYVTVLTQVGAGRAYVDFQQGATLPDDLSEEDRERLLKSNAIGERGGDAEYVAQARPVPGEVEPDEIPADIIPGGSIDQIMAWVGSDLARARVARHEELAKGDKARQRLIKRLDEVKAAEETEPPAVPEHLDGSVQPAPAGGVAVPDEDPGAADGKTADAVPASARRSRS